MENKRRKRGLKNTTSLSLSLSESRPPRKKKDQKHKSERRVLSPVTETTPKKQSTSAFHEREERERRNAGGHFTRTTNNIIIIIMALRQTLKQFTSKTTAFAPLLSRASGVQMYSTVIEGLKYASSHEWYVSTNSFSISVLGELSLWFLLLCCSGTHFLFSLSLYPFYPFVTYTFLYVHRVNEDEGEISLDTERERERKERNARAFTRHRDDR